MNLIPTCKNNWGILATKDFGLTTLLAKTMVEGRCCNPEIKGPCLIVASDYSGSHKESSYDIYSVLLGDLKHCDGWHEARLEIRRQFLSDNRRMSYKGLNDRQRRKALGRFLDAADLIPGVCASLAVSKCIKTLFEQDFSQINPELIECRSWNESLFERVLRIVHIVSFWIAGLSLPHQDVLWFSDEDEIAANSQRLALLTKVWANVMNNYTVHTLRHLKCGTTKCDDGSKEIEDFAAIPDLVAGALSDLLTSIAGQYRPNLIVPLRDGSKAKATFIGHWLSQQHHSLNKIILVIDKDNDSPGFIISRLSFNDLSSYL